MGCCVLRRALAKVRTSQQGMLDVAKCISLKCRVSMLSRYQRINDEMESMSQTNMCVSSQAHNKRTPSDSD